MSLDKIVACQTDEYELTIERFYKTESGKTWIVVYGETSDLEIFEQIYLVENDSRNLMREHYFIPGTVVYPSAKEFIESYDPVAYTLARIKE